MADEHSSRLRLWSQRLKGRSAMLVTAGFVLLGLAIFGQATAWGAAIAFVVSVLLAIALPKSADRVPPVPPRIVSSDPLRDGAMARFADALGDPCIILNQRSLVAHTNPAAARQFPQTRQGDPIAFSMRTPAVLTAVEAARKTGFSQVVEVHQTVPNETWHRLVVSPLATAAPQQDEPAYLVMTLQSLTEQKRVDAMRVDFVANASHELRTPLTSLIGFIDTLLGPAAKDAVAREKFLGIMRSQAERMSKLIDDLLSLGRIEMRQHVRPTDQVELGALLREVHDGLQVLAEDAKVTISMTLPEDPVTVTGERDELYEVFENLLDNAIKYGGDGGKVAVVLEPAVAQVGFDYRITIADNGPGIDAEHVPRLTERFYRGDPETSRKKKGTGLGLAIVKHILARHHGLLTIRSTRGMGTKIEVLLPR